LSYTFFTKITGKRSNIIYDVTVRGVNGTAVGAAATTTTRTGMHFSFILAKLSGIAQQFNETKLLAMNLLS